MRTGVVEGEKVKIFGDNRINVVCAITISARSHHQTTFYGHAENRPHSVEMIYGHKRKRLSFISSHKLSLPNRKLNTQKEPMYSIGNNTLQGSFIRRNKDT